MAGLGCRPTECQTIDFPRRPKRVSMASLWRASKFQTAPAPSSLLRSTRNEVLPKGLGPGLTTTETDPPSRPFVRLRRPFKRSRHLDRPCGLAGPPRCRLRARSQAPCQDLCEHVFGLRIGRAVLEICPSQSRRNVGGPWLPADGVSVFPCESLPSVSRWPGSRERQISNCYSSFVPASIDSKQSVSERSWPWAHDAEARLASRPFVRLRRPLKYFQLCDPPAPAPATRS